MCLPPTTVNVSHTNTRFVPHVFHPPKRLSGQGKKVNSKNGWLQLCFYYYYFPNCKLLRRIKHTHTQDIFYYYRVQLTTNDQFDFTCLREWNEQEPSTDIQTTNCSFISTRYSPHTRKQKKERNNNLQGYSKLFWHSIKSKTFTSLINLHNHALFVCRCPKFHWVFLFFF